MSAELYAAAVRRAGRRRDAHVAHEIEHLAQFCQSPIEQMLGAHLFATDPAILSFAAVIGDWNHSVSGGQGFYVWPQMGVRNYRADFGVLFNVQTGVYRLAVECDGHEFHEKTKEQAQRDKARDREFLEEGWPVMRFTGSEIHRDPMKCADQVGDFLMQQFLRDHAKAKEALT